MLPSIYPSSIRRTTAVFTRSGSRRRQTFVGDPSKVDNPCGNGCSHGFVHAASKTDNFKVGGQPIACLGVYKFIDANNNGIREPNLGEVRIAHWPIIVKDSNGIELNGTMFTIATKECIFFNVLPGTYTIMEGATNGSGTFVVSSNEVDGTYITPADDTIMVKFKPNDLRHDVFFGNFQTAP